MTDAFAGLGPCVHCGFCLPSCPTYVETGDEADSPRGRIVLMQELARETRSPHDAALVRHLDRCLGCRACEPACPSGVAYGPALEAARARIAEVRPVPLLPRLVLATVARQTLRRVVFGLARFVRPISRLFAGNSRVGFLFGMLASTAPWRMAAANRRVTAPTHSHPRQPATVFAGCIQRELFSHVNAAAARTLTTNGYAAVPVDGQGCCGALHAHAGDHEGALRLARANVRAFATAPDALIASTAAGCGAMLRSYGNLLAHDPLAKEARSVADRTRDVTEILADAGPREGGRVAARVVYDAPCHLVHAQRITDPPRAVLRGIPGLDFADHDQCDECCGSAGLYSLQQPRLSRAVLARKVASLAAQVPDLVATGNPGCVMHIGAGLLAAGVTARVVHPVELLDAAYERAGWYEDGELDSTP